MSDYTGKEMATYQLPINEQKCLQSVIEDGVYIKQCSNNKKYGNYCWRHKKEEK